MPIRLALAAKKCMVRLVLVAIRRKHITSLTLSLPVSRFVGAIVGSNNKPEGVIMRLYESVFIARQDITAAQVETMADEFAEIITSAGGSIKKREYWGLRALAYRIKKNRKGHYVMFNLETGSEALKEYERIMGLNEDVLRFLNIRIEEVEEGPSIMMQAKTERPQRGGRDDHDDGDQNEAKADRNDSADAEKSEG
jgi:small subunit ribosomal protein S6